MPQVVIFIILMSDIKRVMNCESLAKVNFIRNSPAFDKLKSRNVIDRIDVAQVGKIAYD